MADPSSCAGVVAELANRAQETPSVTIANRFFIVFLLDLSVRRATCVRSGEIPAASRCPRSSPDERTRGDLSEGNVLLAGGHNGSALSLRPRTSRWVRPIFLLDFGASPISIDLAV